jgi:hypothetical protein
MPSCTCPCLPGGSTAGPGAVVLPPAAPVQPQPGPSEPNSERAAQTQDHDLGGYPSCVHVSPSFRHEQVQGCPDGKELLVRNLESPCTLC